MPKASILDTPTSSGEGSLYGFAGTPISYVPADLEETTSKSVPKDLSDYGICLF